MTDPTQPTDKLEEIQEEIQESTCDTTITAAEPMFAYHAGYSAGALWAMAPERQTRPTFEYFVRWWKRNREKLDATALQQAAAALTQRSNITEQEALDFWNSFCSMLPPSDSQEAIQMFLDGFRWGCKTGFEKAEELRRKAAESKRQQDIENRQRWPGHVF